MSKRKKRRQQRNRIPVEFRRGMKNATQRVLAYSKKRGWPIDGVSLYTMVDRIAAENNIDMGECVDRTERALRILDFFIEKMELRPPIRVVGKMENRKVVPVTAAQRTLPQKKINAFYESWEWKRLRYDHIKKTGRVCLCCGAIGGPGLIIVVDHIEPIRKNWSRRLDPTNLQTLCNDCNMGKGSRDQTDWRAA